MNYYSDNPNPNTLFQGDIFPNVSILFAREKIEIFRPSTGKICSKISIKEMSEIQDAFNNGIEIVLADAHITTIMIISQTCDIANRDFIHISPIFPLTRIETENRKKSIMQGKTNYRFYLPMVNSLEESYVDFPIINSIKKENINIEKRIASLSDHYRHHLDYHLSDFFSRPYIV